MAQKTTLVLYPAPGRGHIVSMVELAKHLLQHSHHFSITILLTTAFHDHPSIHTYIQSISISHPSITFLQLPQLPPSTFPPSTSMPTKAFHLIKQNTPNVITTLKQISKSSTVSAFVIDLFCTSTLEPASALGIPVFYFFTSGAAVLSLFSYFPKIHEQTDVSFKDMVGVELRVPGNAPLKAVNMPGPMLNREERAYWDMLCFCENLPKANGIIVNTFRELEPHAVNAVTEGLCFPQPKLAPPVYFTGPLIAQPTQSQSDGATDSKDFLSWLDAQPSRSVVYLCFGSRGSFSVSQLKEIGNGLENSGQRFLWVVKMPTQDESTKQVDDNMEEFDLSSVLPSGFIERTKDRGLVVRSWIPQVEVLRHESVGAFVSHCGWNSVLEAVVSGVPMIAWPLHAEQHVNRNLMVEHMKVAVAVEQREEDGFVSGEEVERKLKELMESQEIKETCLKIKEMALAAVGENGSSTRALATLIQTWSGTRE